MKTNDRQRRPEATQVRCDLCGREFPPLDGGSMHCQCDGRFVLTWELVPVADGSPEAVARARHVLDRQRTGEVKPTPYDDIPRRDAVGAVGIVAPYPSTGRKQEVIEQLCKMMGRAWDCIDPNGHNPCDCVCKDTGLTNYQNAGEALTFMEEAISEAIARHVHGVKASEPRDLVGESAAANPRELQLARIFASRCADIGHWFADKEEAYLAKLFAAHRLAVREDERRRRERATSAFPGLKPVDPASIGPAIIPPAEAEPNARQTDVACDCGTTDDDVHELMCASFARTVERYRAEGDTKGARLADGWTVCRRLDAGPKEWLADHRGGTGNDVLAWSPDAAKAWRMSRGDAETYKTISYVPAWTEWLGEEET